MLFSCASDYRKNITAVAARIIPATGFLGLYRPITKEYSIYGEIYVFTGYRDVIDQRSQSAVPRYR